MAKGRKGQPGEVKAAKGNPGKRKNPVASTEDLPVLETDVPDILTNAGKVIWKDISVHLEHIKLLRATDRNALTRYCDMLAEYWSATLELRKTGRTYEAPMTNGGTMVRINPLFSIQDRLGRRLDVMDERFGLTPRARQEILYRLAIQVPAAPRLPLEGGAGEKSPGLNPVGFLKSSGVPSGKTKVH